MIDAVSFLDKSDCCPIFEVSSINVMCCPRSSPEEFNDISVVDSISQLECTVSSLKNRIEITRCSCPCPVVSDLNTAPSNSVEEENRFEAPLPNHESSANVALTDSSTLTYPADKTPLPAVGVSPLRTSYLSVAIHHSPRFQSCCIHLCDTCFVSCCLLL